MNTHDFPDGIMVQRFCLTLMGEARLWYASLQTNSNNMAGIATSV